MMMYRNLCHKCYSTLFYQRPALPKAKQNRNLVQHHKFISTYSECCIPFRSTRSIKEREDLTTVIVACTPQHFSIDTVCFLLNYSSKTRHRQNGDPFLGGHRKRSLCSINKPLLRVAVQFCFRKTKQHQDKDTLATVEMGLGPCPISLPKSHTKPTRDTWAVATNRRL